MENSAVFIVQDVTDADNFSSVVDILTHVTTERVIFILVGRYADFSLPNAPFQFPNFTQLSEEVPGENERQCRIDSIAAHKDGMRRMIMVLQKLGLYSKITTFVRDDRFIPTEKPVLSHTNHVLDFLFDRKDIPGTGKIGEFLSQDEYLALVDEYNHVNGVNLVGEGRSILRSESRRERIRTILAGGEKQWIQPSNVLSYEDAKQNSFSVAFDAVTVFLLAPLTGIVAVLRDIQSAPPIVVYGQLFAFNNLDATTKNIFLNQFNVDCDPNAAIAAYDELSTRHDMYRVTLFPTEVTKMNVEKAACEKQLLTSFLALPTDQVPVYPLMQLYTLYCRAKKPSLVVCGTDTYVPEPQYDFDATCLFKSDATDVVVTPVRITWAPLCLYPEVDISRGSNEYLKIDKDGKAQRLGFAMKQTMDDANIVAVKPQTTMRDDAKQRLRSALMMRVVQVIE
jgi:hypothetical protein